jgi:hypothetical protein
MARIIRNSRGLLAQVRLTVTAGLELADDLHVTVLAGVPRGLRTE